MPRYEAGALPDPKEIDSQRLAEYLQQELRRIAGVFAEVDQGRRDALAVEPAKPRVGQLAYADGTNWNPGSGEGYYNYNGTSWVFMGSGAVTPYAPGSFTIPTEYFRIMSKHLILTGTQRATIAGTARLRIT